MAKEYYYLYVVMCDDTGDESMLPGVSAVFESRRKAEAYVAEKNAESIQYRYYLDTSFHNVFED